MIEGLVEYVAGLPVEEAGRLNLQDMALCQAWGAADPSDARGAALRARIDAWKAAPVRADEETEGRRHQLLLRESIEALEHDKHQDLLGDELAFVGAALDLARASAQADCFGRVLGLLGKHEQALEGRRVALKPSAGLSSLTGRIEYASERDIRRAPHRETRLLAGIELPSRGPVLTCQSNLRVLGDVPDNCTVVVEGDAACSVEGYVLGRVLAKRDCEVRGNIAGIAVVLHGDVRARGIINNATVVAKMGSVHCRNAQGPRLIFASKAIHVAEGAMLGRFVTRFMSVANDVRGGQIQVSGMVEAGHFRHLGASNLAIVLRRELSCEDFGEVTGTELNRLLSDAYRLRGLAHNYDTMEGMARRECEHQAQSTLMYLFGGSETHKKLEDMATAQRRLKTLERTVDTLGEVLEAAEDHLSQRDSAGRSFASEEVGQGLEDDGPLDQDLAQEHEAARKYRQKLKSRKLSTAQAADMLSELNEKLERLDKERENLEVTIAQRAKELQSLEQYGKLLSKGGKSTTKLDMLQRILPSLRKQPPQSPVVGRLKSAFVEMALRNVDRQLRHATQYNELASKYRNDFQAVSDRLGKDFQMRVLENPSESEVARAIGRFDGGVRIYMDVFIEDEKDIPKGGMVITPDGDKEVRTYVRPTRSRGYHLQTHP